MTNLDYIAERIREYESQLSEPLPTPPVGTMVWWFKNGRLDMGQQQAAVVTAVEGPAKLTLAIWPPKGMPVHKTGVHYINDPTVKNREHDNIRRSNGLWCYPFIGDDFKQKDIRKHHFDVHTDQLKRKIEAMHEEHRIKLQEQKARAGEDAPEPVS